MCLDQASPIDVVVIIYSLVFVLHKKEFDVILDYDCILDLCGVLNCYPLDIDDDHHSAPRVQGVELPVVVGVDTVTCSLQLACFIHVAVHSDG